MHAAAPLQARHLAARALTGSLCLCAPLLQEEQSRVLKLEAQLAEATSRLGVIDELQRELDKIRKLVAEQESKKASGLWGYISGQ
jgi:hypothetical protein